MEDEADQVSEDKIGLDRGQRRDAQRRLTKLGFDVHVSGKFDDETRGVIKRWQAVRGYPSTGYLNKAQHAALIGEQLAARTADEDVLVVVLQRRLSSSRRSRHSSGGGGGRRYARSGGGGPGGFIGHVDRRLLPLIAPSVVLRERRLTASRLFSFTFHSQRRVPNESRQCRAANNKSARCAPKTQFQQEKRTKKAKQRP